MKTVYYRRRGVCVSFACEGKTHTYWYYSTRDAYRKFKKEILGITRAHLEKDDSPITYGFLY